MDAEDVVQGPLEKVSQVSGECGQIVFTGCRRVKGELKALPVKSVPTDGTEAVSRDADGEVRFPIIDPHRRGLRAVLQDRWGYGSGYYSLLRHGRALAIEDSPHAVRWLATSYRRA